MKILKKLRIDKGLSQVELGEILGISASQVGMIEQGRRKPSLDILIQISEVFDLPIDFLLRRTEVREPVQIPDIFNMLLKGGGRTSIMIKRAKAIDEDTILYCGKQIHITKTKRDLFLSALKVILEVEE